RELIQDLRVAGRGDPRSAEVAQRFVVATHVLGELRCATESTCALRVVLGALRLVVPERDAFVVLAGRAEESIELFDERRVLGIERERTLDVTDRGLHVAEALL